MLRRLASGLIVSAIGLAAVLVLLEFGLRFLGVGNDAVAQPHPWAGWVLIPSHRADVASEDPSLGRRMRIDTDSLGLRDVERTAAKPAGVYRVLLLGDSYVQAEQVPFDSTLGRQLERSLDGRGGRRVEVWNCGVDGYTTSQELLYLRHVAVRYRPDLVVLCFFAGNDVADQVPQVATTLRNRPFFRLSGGDLELDRSFFKPDNLPIAWLRVHSRLYGWATTQRRVMMLNMKRRAEAEWRGPGFPPSLQIYALQPDSLWNVAWELSGRLIGAVRDEARLQGADFLLVSISDGVQEHAEARRWPGWPEHRERPGLSLDEPERRLGAVAAASGIDYLPLLPAFREEAARTGRPLHIRWNGHWNSAGHALAARLIAPRIAERIERGATEQPAAGPPQP